MPSSGNRHQHHHAHGPSHLKATYQAFRHAILIQFHAAPQLLDYIGGRLPAFLHALHQLHHFVRIVWLLLIRIADFTHDGQLPGVARMVLSAPGYSRQGGLLESNKDNQRLATVATRHSQDSTNHDSTHYVEKRGGPEDRKER